MAPGPGYLVTTPNRVPRRPPSRSHTAASLPDSPVASPLALHPGPSSRGYSVAPRLCGSPVPSLPGSPVAPRPGLPRRAPSRSIPRSLHFRPPRGPSCRPLLRCPPSRAAACPVPGSPVAPRLSFLRALTPLSNTLPPSRVPSVSTSPLASRWSDGPVVVARGRFHTQCVQPGPLTVEAAMPGTAVVL